MYRPVPGFEPTSPVFLGECVSQEATVVDTANYTLENREKACIEHPIMYVALIHCIWN